MQFAYGVETSNNFCHEIIINGLIIIMNNASIIK